MRMGLDHLAAALAGTAGPSSGQSPEKAAKLVADVDLDRPGDDLGEVLAELSRVYLDDAVWFHEPGYAAHLNCPVVIPALLAELFVSGVNSSLDTFDQSVGGTFVERRLVDWTARRIGFEDHPEHGADGIFTSGGTQSNLQALHIARDLALAGAAGGDVRRLRVLASDQAHFSVQTGARLLGLADEQVVPVRSDDRRRMDVGALEDALDGCHALGLVPMAVVATAGTTDFGAIDPLLPIADLCHLHATWLHVDAAYGGGLLVSRRHRHRLSGIERADSVTVDYHKTWFQPVSSSALIVRDRRSLSPVTWHADYLNPQDPDGTGHPNQVDKSMQTTRRFDALKLWLTLRVMGADRIGDYLDTVIELAVQVHARIDELDRIDVAAAPELSTLVFRCRPAGVPEGELAALNDAVRLTLYERGAAMVAATTVEGSRWLKLTLLNPAATVDSLTGIVEQARSVADELAADRVLEVASR
ncbi:MAG: aminotransferase class I/II-fold pyridoxal phosphate-dependent enzyme [Nocardioides sp.]|nr:aminotransferase class I/II-fold pyridoxal phosphate-dependent enzyme [Nocardioides sp.]